MNQDKLEQTHFTMKFPENSPYNTGKHYGGDKPNANLSDKLKNAKRADFCSHLTDTSIKFSRDPRNYKFDHN